MIKITNQQLSAFNFKIINNLLDDENRPFPVTDAFRIADFIQQIQSKLQVYHERARKIILAAGGKVDEKGQVTYDSAKDFQAADQDIKKLDSVEVELTGESLTMSSDWPKLSLKEALILRPLLSLNGKEALDAKKDGKGVEARAHLRRRIWHFCEHHTHSD